jgi:mannose-6-phosphate isomerase-like protein (cupin superfamily)
MNIQYLEKIKELASKSSERYLEFLKVPDLSMGIYTLKVGEKDLQSPHNEDEVYLVLKGKAIIQIEDEKEKIEAGSIVYVPARAPHKFLDIRKELQLLVFFAPAES